MRQEMVVIGNEWNFGCCAERRELSVKYRGRKTPDLDLREAETMGYKLAIVPGLLIKSVVGICDQMLAALQTTGL